jgi:hypothetical protein
MVSTQVSAAAAAASLTILYFTKIESGEVLAAFWCLALAHRARVTGGRVTNGSARVLGLDEIGHGLTRRQGAERRANK